ncbi:hypothetical protein E3O45_05225 [Cryobacterium sp. TMS1-20-1]|uniref:hypothetical protein n=1 Tax=Cryobacterium sp. TMS1-20-1 TaxID=1259223 RepID=UPI001100D90B|nr:hypothetical protein [Cryobacterium sp. TMS1-20-1]TFC78910.1 hypothetical protein E3O45_05225 [Cryobacterium sp. TMS1-20-1]
MTIRKRPQDSNYRASRRSGRRGPVFERKCCHGHPTASPAKTPATTANYPVTVDNCGTSLTVAAAPERIVSIKSSATDLLLALELGDLLVGSAFLDGRLSESLAAAGSDLNVISDFLPGQEAVLGVNPDFIYGGWVSNFSADGVGERPARRYSAGGRGPGRGGASA